MFSAASLQLKLIAIIVVLAVAGGIGAYVAWSVRSEMAHKEAKEAVADARADWDKALKAKDALIATYSKNADDRYGELLKKVGDIKVVHTTVTNNIKGSVERYPVFYAQPLPGEGYMQWLDARKLLQ